MSEQNPNERLGERLLSLGHALTTPKTNGTSATSEVLIAMRENTHNVEWAKAYVETPEGKRVAALIDVKQRPIFTQILEASEELDKIVEYIAVNIGELLTPLRARIVELEAQVADLTRRKGLAPLAAKLAEIDGRGWAGIWDAERSYRPKQEVTYGGNLWHCQKACSNVRPGTSDDWKLMQSTKPHR